MVDFITSLDGDASGEGWPGFSGLEGPEYLAGSASNPPVHPPSSSTAFNNGIIGRQYRRHRSTVVYRVRSSSIQ